MTLKQKKDIRKQFGDYLKYHREQVLKINSVLQLSYESNLDNSKLTKIEKGLINFTFDTLVEIATTYRLPKRTVFGFASPLLSGLD